MIRHRPDPWEPEDTSAPWDTGTRVERLAFCTLWATGPDTALDGVFRILALRPAEGGGWDVYDRFCRPFEDGEPEPSATRRMAREFGVTGADLEGAATVAEAWSGFRAFVGDAPLLVPVGDVFDAWYDHLEDRGDDDEPAVHLGLDEMAALVTPGRLANLREGLVAALHPDRDRSGPAHPPDLVAALAELVRRLSGADPRVLRVAATGYSHAWEALTAVDPSAARRLALALAIVDRPSAWARSAGGLFAVPADLEDGRLSAALEGLATPETLLDGLRPRWATAHVDWLRQDPLLVESEETTPFAAEDERLVDDLFQVHLPAVLGGAGSAHGDFYRASQHRVAREIGRLLGSEELLLVHAPTGTGKTMAYLVPALLWARRHGVRVGIATYTRALQEQAMDREVPRVLSGLARAGVPSGFRVSLLKGRENYVCWRALRLVVPSDDDDGESWLAWTSLALFALTDADGDLDRFPVRAPVRMASTRRHRKLLASFARQVRARTACCTHATDRETCAAEVARRRAERSHVVITNQSFALARQDFFKHLVFDECEHLHEQAHNAWSHSLGFRWAREILRRLHRVDGGPGGGPLDRLGRRLAPGSAAYDALRECLGAWDQTAGALARLEESVVVFEEWRTAARRGRSEHDEHSLFREYVGGETGDEMIDARRFFVAVANELDGRLAEVAEHLETVKLRGIARIRRSIDLSRSDLADAIAAVESWLPLEQGVPAFRRETFYDVETDNRGNRILAARVLLPNEYLGRNYYPALRNAAFVSATTRLRGGFDAALGYLGLDRAAEPSPEEERPGRTVRTFHAPEVFDYGRVLAGVPRDAPPVKQKEAHLDYVREFVAWMAERTRGRMLVLFTNLEDVRTVGEELAGRFRARRIPFWYQGMEDTGKEELSELFRSRVDSVLLGVDTFWYGADFPGETLEYLVIVRLPFGVPDRYHHAQCAALGREAQRRRIYMPRALAKFRQGFGRLMRRTSDRGCVFMLDNRVVDPRHRDFLRELPLGFDAAFGQPTEERACRLVRGDTERVGHEALAHMDMLADVRRRGLVESFLESSRLIVPRPAPPRRAATDDASAARPTKAVPPPVLDIRSEDLPF